MTAHRHSTDSHDGARSVLKPLNFSLRWFEEISSTSDVARELAKSGAAEGTVVVARRQTAGRGKFSSRWFSPEGGLYFTLVLRPEIPAGQSHLLAVAAGLAVADAIELAIGASPQLKWPNDIYLSGKKVAGVLTETEVSNQRVRLALVGIGVNVERPDFGVPDHLQGSAVWLSELGTASLTELLTGVLDSFIVWYQRLKSGDFAMMAESYNRRGLLVGRNVEVRSASQVAAGRCRGIDAQGALVIEQSRGFTTVAAEGEVCSWS